MANYSTTSTVMLNGQQAEDMLKKLTKRSEELGQQWKAFREAGDTSGMKKVETQMKSVDKATEKLYKETLSVEKVLKNLSGASLNDLLTVQKKLNTEMAKMDHNSAEFKQAAKNAAILKNEIAQTKIAMGQWSSPMEKALGFAKGLLPAFSFAAILGGAKAAFNQIVNSTDTLSTQWAIFTGGLSEGMNEFWRTIATGDWSNFIGNMEKAIQVGRNYQSMLDEIEEKQRALTIIEADYEEEINATEIAVKNKLLSETERIKAAERRIEIEKELAKKRTDIAQATFDNELDIATQQTKLSKETLMQVAGDFDSMTKQKAKAYNKQRDALKKLREIEASEASQTGVAATESPRMKQLQHEMDIADSSIKIYAGYLDQIGNSTDDQLNKLTDSYAKMRQAQNSAESNTKKVHTSMYTLISQTNKEIAETYEKESEARQKQIEKDFNLAALLEADIETQKAALKKYFSAIGDEAWDGFMAAIEKSQAAKNTDIDFSIVPELPEETEQANPTVDYGIQKYKETLEFKLAMNQAMYDNDVIGKEQYEDTLTELTRQGEEERLEIKKTNQEKIHAIAGLAVSLVTSLMDLELEKAGENEEKKKEIKKKYADMQFAMTAAQIIANTAEGASKAFAQGGVLGFITGGLIIAAGLVELGIANAQRQKVKALAKGKYPVTADDGNTFTTTFSGRPKTGMYNGPQLGIFNEVPGHPEMVIDGITLRKIELNAPGIIKSIYAIRDGRMPKYAEGKYPISNTSVASNIVTNDAGRVAEIEQNKILHELTTEIRELRKWRPNIAVETIERQRNNYYDIQNKRGL